MASIIVIPADDSLPVRSWEKSADDAPSLAALQAWVGCFIEAVPHWDDYKGLPAVAYCNEEGKLHALPPNRRATILWWQKLGQIVDDVLVGNVVLCVNFEEDADNGDA